MTERLGVEITAKDGASKAFQEVGKNADKMGKDIESSAKRSSRALKDLDLDYRQLGISAGIAAGGFALIGSAARDQEIALATLSRGYGDAADGLREYAQQIQDTTNFSNDQAVAAANVFRTLSENYGYTADQIEQLISISADLAASQGLSLTDAATRVQSAMRGEAEAAEFLGLTLNDHALGIDRMAASTSEYEKSQVRFVALQDQSAFAMGASQEQAAGFYGELVNLKDGAQDNVQAFGQWLGPLGDMGAFMADNALQISAMTLAMGQLGSTAKSLQGMIGVGGLAGSAGIAGLGIAAAAAAVGGIYLLGTALKADLPEASQASIDSMQELINTIVEAGDQSEYAITLLKLDDVMQDNKTAVDAYSGSAEALAAVQNELYQSFDASKVAIEDMMAPLDAEIFNGLTDAQKDVIDANDDMLISVQELQVATENWKTTAESAEEVNNGLAAGIDELGQIWRMTGDAGQFAQGEAQAYIEALLKGEITAEQFEQLLQNLITGYENAGEAALEAAANTASFSTALDKAGGAAHQVAGELGMFLDRVAHGVEEVDENREAWEKWQKTVASNQYVMQLQHDSSVAVGIALGHVVETMNTGKDAVTDFWQPIIDGAAEFEKRLEELGTQFESAQKQFTSASDTLDTVYGAIVGNTNAIAKQSQEVQDWADKLIGAAGTYAEIDDLLQAGAITLDDYTAAQEAYNVIADANTRIQQDVLSIQAQLAPVIATATEALATQMDQLAQGDTDAQLFALGMMDAATSSQALALAQGYLQDRSTFGPMIEEAARLNPMLAQILEEMGLISYNPATGEVSLLGVDEAQSDLEILNETMEHLNQTVATLIAVLQDDASDPIGDVQALADALGITVATPTAELVDLASGPLYAIMNLVDGLNGRTATTYVQTVYESVTSDTRFGAQMLGGVAGYDLGGMVTIRAGEAGAERFDFPGGGHGMAWSDGLYSVPRGTYVNTAPATAAGGYGGGPLIGELHVHATGSDEEVAERVTRVIVPAIQRAMRQHVRATGGNG